MSSACGVAPSVLYRVEQQAGTPTPSSKTAAKNERWIIAFNARPFQYSGRSKRTIIEPAERAERRRSWRSQTPVGRRASLATARSRRLRRPRSPIAGLTRELRVRDRQPTITHRVATLKAKAGSGRTFVTAFVDSQAAAILRWTAEPVAGNCWVVSSPEVLSASMELIGRASSEAVSGEEWPLPGCR